MRLFILFIAILLATGCSSDNSSEGTSEVNSGLNPTVVKVTTNSMDIVMADSLTSGLNQFVYENRSPMTHFLLINKLPAGITFDDYVSELTPAFQRVMDSINIGSEPVYEFPDWVGKMVNYGGVGLTSAGQSSESIINLVPGDYVVECYIKSNGIFHSANGMIVPLTVVQNPEENRIVDPVAPVSVTVSETGMELKGEIPQYGGNVLFEVNFGKKKAYPNFTWADLHLIKVTEGADVGAVEEYMDWMNIKGMDQSAPVVFLGGVQEMPEGSTAYFKQYLSGGKYILTAEVPNPKAEGFWYEFEIDDN